MSALLDRAISELMQLSEPEKDLIAAQILEQIDILEAVWEERALTQTLGDALLADGSIDIEKLRGQSISITLDELCPECVDDDEDSAD